MQPEQVVAALQGLATEAIEVESPAAGHQDALAAAAAVVEALEIVPPAPVPVDFVEHPERRRRELAAEDPLAALGHVPVQVALRGARDVERQRGLSDLTRPGDEDHLAGQVAGDLTQQVTGGRA